MSAQAAIKNPLIESDKDNTSNKAEHLWFIARGTVLKGPYTFSQLEQKIQKKEISYLDYCWRQGFNEWRPLASIDQFDRRTRLKRVLSYPAVPVPGSSKNTGANLNTRQKTWVELRFSKRMRGGFSIYEWAFAALFAMVLSYASAQYALYQVKVGFMVKVENASAGRPEHVGHSEQALSAEFWQPLFSAPSYVETKDLIELPVRIEGLARSNNEGHYEVANYKLNPRAALKAWEAQEKGLDPVLVRPLIVEGYLAPGAPATVDVYQDGEPLLRERRLTQVPHAGW